MESKNFLLSKTVLGILVATLVQVLARKGITVDESGLTNDVVALAALGFSIYGRFTAKQPVHVITPKETSS